MPTLNWIGKDKMANFHLDVPFINRNTNIGFMQHLYIDY